MQNNTIFAGSEESKIKWEKRDCLRFCRGVTFHTVCTVFNIAVTSFAATALN
jgi:hypothetical protein